MSLARDLAADARYGLREALSSVRRPQPPRDGRAWSATQRHVLLIPGVWESWHMMEPVGRTVARLGARPHVVPELGRNRGEIAEATRSIVALLEARDARDVVIVGHSKGGLIGKDVLLATPRASGLIAICSPFSGSSLSVIAPGRSLRAFGPRRPDILRLGAELLVNERIVSIFPAFDPMVPGGSRMQGARNVPVATAGHFRILTHPVVESELQRMLG